MLKLNKIKQKEIKKCTIFNIIIISTNLIIFLSVFNISLFDLKAQSSDGGYAESYLQRNVGTRAIAMAGTYTAISNDPFAIFYNPAGLSSLTDETKISTMYSFLEFGRNQSTICWGQTFNNNLGLGFGINSFSAGSFVARDVSGNPIGNYSNTMYDIIGGAAYSLEYASAGIAMKYLTNSLNGTATAANGYAVDLGMKFNVANLFTFGLSMQNLSGTMYWNTESKEQSKIPYTIRVGIAMEQGLNDANYISRSPVSGEMDTVYEPPSRYLLGGLDIIYSQNDKNPTFVIGGEFIPHEALAIRAGLALAGDKFGKYTILPMTYWGAGISIMPNIKNLPFKFNIDYSIAPDYISSSSIGHHIAINFIF